MKENENGPCCGGEERECFSACFMDGAAVPESRPKPRDAETCAPEKENAAKGGNNTDK